MISKATKWFRGIASWAVVLAVGGWFALTPLTSTALVAIGDIRAELDPDEMLVVLSLPSMDDPYYAEVFADIVDFHIDYANLIHGNDRVILLADTETMPLLRGRVPAEVLFEANPADIWMRDFTTVNPFDPVMFRYDGDYFDDPRTPRDIQWQFRHMIRAAGVEHQRSSYILDGGNVVDNYRGSIVVSERFLEDNQLGRETARQILRDEYGADHVAIIPYDDPVMGHADGMVMFVDDVLLVNRYAGAMRRQIMAELRSQLPAEITIVEVEADISGEIWKDFSSACGVNVNSLVTTSHVYVPTFGNTATDLAFVETLRQHTDKSIHLIDASDVCYMGGSVRCLSWQLGPTANSNQFEPDNIRMPFFGN